MSQFVALGVDEAKEVYRDLVKLKRPIQLQINGEKVKLAKVQEREGDEVFFKLPYIDRFEGSFDAVVTFSLPPEIYFLKTKITGEGGKYSFREVQSIFRLQRRDTFRLSIPEAVEAGVKFNDVEEVYKIHDLSQGGFSIELPAKRSDEFITGSQLKADLELLDQTFLGIDCEAKHARILPLNKKSVLVGFQFLKLSFKQEQQIFSVITDIARTHFRR